MLCLNAGRDALLHWIEGITVEDAAILYVFLQEMFIDYDCEGLLICALIIIQKVTIIW